MSKVYMLTVRYQPNDIDLFEDFIAYFFTQYFLRWTKVIAGIEYDGTPDRHLHCIFEDNTSRDRGKVMYYLTKDFKPFFLKLKDTATQVDKTLHSKAFQLSDKYKNEELYWRMGYPLKQSPHRVHIRGFEELEVHKYKDAYIRYIQQKNRKVENVVSFRHLTIKTVLPQVFNYFIKNKSLVTMSDIGTNIQDLMEDDNYSFIEISRDKINYVRRMLRRRFYPEYEASSFYDDPEITLTSDTPKHKLLEEIEFYKYKMEELQKENSELNEEITKLRTLSLKMALP